MRLTRLFVVLAAGVLLSACTVALQHDLNEQDANEIYVLLTQNAIDATKVKEGEGKEARFVIMVPKASLVFAAELLKNNSLPRPMADGLAIFKQTKGMIPTQTEERAMFIEALGGEVSNALNRIDGVLEARVIINQPEVTDLTQPENKPKPSASVLLKYIEKADDPKPPVDIDQIREFVARAVPELTKDNVKVLLSPTVPAAVADPEKQPVTHFGVQMTKESVGTFRMIIALPAVIALLSVGGLALVLMRKPGSNGRKAKANEESEEDDES